MAALRLSCLYFCMLFTTLFHLTSSRFCFLFNQSLAALVDFYSREHSPYRNHSGLIAEHLRSEARNPATMPLRRSAEIGSVRFPDETDCAVARPLSPASTEAGTTTRCFCFGG
ncbi:hypothetical protein FAE58_005574 [Escherichia coli]|nr:hypothetical protein [Escherichia coli]EFK4537577.1 hypothetical protein [Escherichia coli]EKA0662458.1 hypothetical protein [Escherichia coli]EKH3979621.1 hypothetical protein [Escherichia coli]